MLGRSHKLRNYKSVIKNVLSFVCKFSAASYSFHFWNPRAAPIVEVRDWASTLRESVQCRGYRLCMGKKIGNMSPCTIQKPKLVLPGRILKPAKDAAGNATKSMSA